MAAKKNKLAKIKILVPGGLNTDLIGYGVKEILAAGELTLGGELHIQPGGKARNIAQMIALLMGPQTVAMIGKTAQDPFGLWKVPLQALRQAKVNCDFIQIEQDKKNPRWPGVALIPIDRQGKNQIYVLPGVNQDFQSRDLARAKRLFSRVKQNRGILALTLEMPLATAIFAARQAAKNKIKIVLDPGGINKQENYLPLLNQDIFLIKPNEHEAEILTGIKVKDFKTAQQAAKVLLNYGIQNVLITQGKFGAYLFNQTTRMHFPIPKIKQGKIQDETGCGDQTMAVLCAYLAQGWEITAAARLAILAGTMQFYRLGVRPVTKKELARL